MILPTPCPDCDPHGFDKNLETFYGPPLHVVEGKHGTIKIYADPRVSTTFDPPMIEAKAWARSFCPKHGRATEQAKLGDG